METKLRLNGDNFESTWRQNGDKLETGAWREEGGELKGSEL